tara:strand:+ start:106 stop:393 length:288 start_codon:yes stop_codon:yes gene_type:complete
MAECYTDYLVTRYEWYPSDSPTGVCVGFTAKCTPNGRANYWDTIVASSSASGKTDTEVVGLAWDTLSGTLVPWGETQMHESSLIGETYKTISGSA